MRLLFGFLPVIVALAACTMPAASQAERDAPAPVCSTQTFEQGARTRLYVVCAPQDPPDRPMAVLMGFHGGLGRAEQWRDGTKFHLAASARENVTLYMQGCATDGKDCSSPTVQGVWNVGKPGLPNVVDDHGYVEAVLNRLQNVHHLEIDRTRIYATGHSLGGIYIYSLMCDRPGLLAAIGPISAPPSDATCKPGGRTSIFHVHGTKDANVPFDTGCCSKAQQTPGNPEYLERCTARPLCFNPANWWPPVRSGDHPRAQFTGLDAIAQRMQCSSTLTRTNGVGAKTACYAFTGCARGLKADVCMVEDVDHNLRTILDTFSVPDYYWKHFLNHHSAAN